MPQHPEDITTRLRKGLHARLNDVRGLRSKAQAVSDAIELWCALAEPVRAQLAGQGSDEAREAYIHSLVEQIKPQPASAVVAAVEARQRDPKRKPRQSAG